MKFLVTGGAGFIGSHLVDQLILMGHEVIVIDNAFGEEKDFFWNESAYNYQYDIRDYDSIRPLFDEVDVVFHLAARSRIQPAINNPIDAISVNSLGTYTVLQASREAGVKRFIYSSTSSAYGHNPIPNIETQNNDCLNPYSISKVNGELFCKIYYDLYHLKTISLRYFNVYGPRQPIKGQYATVVGIFLNQMRNNKPLTIVGDGKQRRDFTHVFDVVNANIIVATKAVLDDAFGSVYNVGSGKNYSVNQLAKMISSSIHFIPPRIGEARETLANYQKIKDTFAWVPTIALEDWISGEIK
jgi:UDP-glucose 4-epimerase